MAVDNKEMVLIEGFDHGYDERSLVLKKVTYNKKYKKFLEYFGDEYLEPDEEVVYKLVVE